MRCLILAAAFGMLACSSTSHSDLTTKADTGTTTKPVETDSGSGGDDTGGGGDDAGAPEDASTADAVDVFAGAPAFTPVTPKAVGTLDLKHIFHTGKSLTGSDCASSCHDGSHGDAPALAFGGTVYYGPDAKTVAPGVEVRVRDKAGKDWVVYSDQGGNFWQLGDASAFGWPAHTGVRTATDAILMTGDFKIQGCNAADCHDGSTDYPRITVPPAP